MSDLAPPALIEPALFLVMALLALPVAFLPAHHDRAKRSLALLVVLVGAFAVLRELLPLPLSSGLSLAVFLGLYAVFRLMGKFDSRE